MTYLREFITSPLMVGAIAPSSRALAQLIVDAAEVRTARSVLEFGPGSGIFTEFILRDLGRAARFAAIELNPRFARQFRSRFPGIMLFEESVENVEDVCRRAGMRSVDAIVSGIPWAFFPRDLQIRCLDAMRGVLAPGGRFVTFTYVHNRVVLSGARRFASVLPRYFASVSRSPVVWRNFPPAFIYRCRS